MDGEEDPQVAALLDRVEHLSRALETRTTIGKALGILMQRLDIDDEQAWCYLSRCSQEQNRRVCELARAIVETRELPECSQAHHQHAARRGG